MDDLAGVPGEKVNLDSVVFQITDSFAVHGWAGILKIKPNFRDACGYDPFGTRQLRGLARTGRARLQRDEHYRVVQPIITMPCVRSG